MAKYNIEMRCGHTETHQIYGTDVRGERGRKAKQIAQKPCTACRDSTNQMLGERAAEVATAEGWPTLAGSSKQVIWAEAIRADAIAQLAAEADRRSRESSRAGWTDAQAQQLADLTTRIWQRVALRWGTREWIDNQNRIVAAAAGGLTAEDRAEYNEGVAAIVAGLSPEATAQTQMTPGAPKANPEPSMTLDEAAERNNLQSAIAEADDRAAHAQLARAAAIAEIGELLRRANATKPPLIRMTEVEQTTRLTRPTLTDARGDEAAWRTLGQLAAGARDGNEEDLVELHRRLPRLAGWRNAAEHLQRQHIEEYWAARGGFDPWSTDDPGYAPGYEMLIAVHDAEVAAYAAGEPAYLSRLSQRTTSLVTN